MDPSIEHPLWILTGFALVFIGIWLVRWASRNDMTSAISQATTQSAIGALLRRSSKPGERKAGAEEKASRPTGYAARHAMSQLAGAVGFIMIVAGLLTVVLGVYYE